MERRKFVRTTGAVALGGLVAGCAGSGGTETQPQTESETQTETGTPTPQDAADAPVTVTPEDIEGEVSDDLPSQFEVSSHQIVAEENWYVSGDIRNTGDEAAEAATVAVTLYDGDTELTTATASVQDEQYDGIQSIPAGGAWAFRATITADVDMSRVTRYVVDVTTG